MKRNTFFLLAFAAVAASMILLYYRSLYKQAKFQSVGEFRYKITDTALFEKTYLSEDSYGYLITDSNVQGLEIIGFDFKSNDGDLIVSLNHPIKAVYINSKKVRNESGGLFKKPVEIIKDAEKKDSRFVFLYYLKPGKHYRLLLP